MHGVAGAIVVRRGHGAVGVAPREVDPDARVVVELLRERRRARPVDRAEARAPLQPTGGSRQPPQQRALEAERDRSQRKAARGPCRGPAAGTEGEKALRGQETIQVHHPVSRAAAAVIGDDRDAGIARSIHQPADGRVERAIHSCDGAGVGSRHMTR